MVLVKLMSIFPLPMCLVVICCWHSVALVVMFANFCLLIAWPLRYWLSAGCLLAKPHDLCQSQQDSKWPTSMRSAALTVSCIRNQIHLNLQYSLDSSTYSSGQGMLAVLLDFANFLRDIFND